MPRVPTTNMVLAMRSLKMRLGNDAVEWATDQLSKGWDSKHLRQLAGLTGRENPFELEDTFDRVLGEFGIHKPNPEQAVVLYAQELARDYLSGLVTRDFFLLRVFHLCTSTGYPRELMPLYLLRDALEDLRVQGWSYCYCAVSREDFDDVLKGEVDILLGSLAIDC